MQWQKIGYNNNFHPQWAIIQPWRTQRPHTGMEWPSANYVKQGTHLGEEKQLARQVLDPGSKTCQFTFMPHGVLQIFEKIHKKLIVLVDLRGDLDGCRTEMKGDF